MNIALADEGVLFLAHGSIHGGGHGHGHGVADPHTCGYHHPPIWEQSVLEMIESLRGQSTKDIEVAFGMWSTDCFNLGIERLREKMAARGKTLDSLRVIPLYLSSYSPVIEMQKYIFGKRPDLPLPIPTARIAFQGPIDYRPAIDYNPHLSMILSNRLQHLIQLAREQNYSLSQMEVVFVMHGPISEEDNTHWVEMAQKYLRDLSYLLPVGKFHIVSLRDDADRPTRDEATKIFRQFVSGAQEKGGVALVLPYLISKGGIETGILKRLDGLDYIWTGEMILPDLFFQTVILNMF